MLCMWLLLLDKALLSSWGTSCIDQTIRILIKIWLIVDGTSIFDINKKNMSRTIIPVFETANVSGNGQSEHSYYHYSIKKFTVLILTIGFWQD